MTDATNNLVYANTVAGIEAFTNAGGATGVNLYNNTVYAPVGDAIRVLIRPKEVRYYLIRGEDVLEVRHHDEYVDRGVYLLLAELAARA